VVKESASSLAPQTLPPSLLPSGRSTSDDPGSFLSGRYARIRRKLMLITKHRTPTPFLLPSLPLSLPPSSRSTSDDPGSFLSGRYARIRRKLMLITIVIPTTLALGAIGDCIHWYREGREGGQGTKLILITIVIPTALALGVIRIVFISREGGREEG